MKKIYALLLISAMAVSLTACGASASTASSSEKAESTAAEAEDTKENIGEDTEEKSDALDYSAYCGMWYNMDTALAEVVLSEGSVSFRGDEYEIVEVLPAEAEDSDLGNPYCVFYTGEMEDGSCLEFHLFESEGTDGASQSMSLYQVNKDAEADSIELGVFVNDIKYTNGDPSMIEMETETEDAGAAGAADSAVTVSENATLYLMDYVETEDGSKQSVQEFGKGEFALVYDTSSPCMTGMLFTDSVVNFYRIGSDEKGLQLEVDVPKSDGQSEFVWLPMAFDENEQTMTLDFSGTDLKVKKIVFKVTGLEEFFSGNREMIATML